MRNLWAQLLINQLTRLSKCVVSMQRQTLPRHHLSLTSLLWFGASSVAETGKGRRSLNAKEAAGHQNYPPTNLSTGCSVVSVMRP